MIELAQVFGEIRFKGHLFAWLVRMFKSQDFSVQRLAREVDARGLNCIRPVPRVISSVAHEWQAGMGCLNPNLVLAAGLQTQP